MSTSSIDGDGRSVQTLTLRALKTYENHGPTFELLYAFSIIFIGEQKFSTAVSGEICDKRNSANAMIRWQLVRAFERGA